MTPNERAIADVYAAWFAARTDDYVGWTGTTWVRADRPLTAETVWAGIRGGPSVSGYFITPQQTTHVAAIDFDTDDGLDLAKRLRATMAEKGVTGHVEMSRRGAHLWLLIDRELPARVVRRALKAYLRDAGIEVTDKVELRPVGDEIKPDGFGSPLRLPTMPNPKTGLRYPVLGADDKPLPAAIDAMMLRMGESPAWRVESAAASVRPTMADLRAADRRPYLGPSTEGSASDILRTRWGALDARPNHTIKCPSPAHQDKVPSLSILTDDQRAICKSPACELNNGDKGRGTYELTKMAPQG